MHSHINMIREYIGAFSCYFFQLLCSTRAFDAAFAQICHSYNVILVIFNTYVYCTRCAKSKCKENLSYRNFTLSDRCRFVKNNLFKNDLDHEIQSLTFLLLCTPFVARNKSLKRIKGRKWTLLCGTNVKVRIDI